MAIDATSSTTSTTTSEVAAARTTIAENFDTFLSILTTQLQNQNPLEPLDTNQFTQQLVQFTGVEQQLQTNEFLEALLNASNSEDITTLNMANQAVNLIGKTVVAGASTATLEDGNASWTYTLSSDAPDTQVTIRNSAGETVYSGTHSLSAGQGNFEWDGQDQSGIDYEDGTYSITIDAKNASGQSVTALTQVQGLVESADLTGSEPVLIVDGVRIYLESILSVSAAS